LTKIDFTTKDLSPDNTRVKSVFKTLRNAIVDLKLQINITEEEVRKSNEIRLIRANDVSIILTAKYDNCFWMFNEWWFYSYIFTDFSAYEGFEACRRKNFHKNKIGERLLLQVHKALPWNITYNNQVKEVLLFLAKVKFQLKILFISISLKIKIHFKH